LLDVVIENPNKGKIKFDEEINLTSGNQTILDLDSYINISFNRIEIDSENLPNLNVSATLILYDLSFSNPRILKNGAVCPSEICILNGYSDGNLNFSVTGFSAYSSEESPQITEAVTSGGGRREKAISECEEDSGCAGEYEYCWEGKCVKIFDIKIIDFESPVNLGEFFDFTYFLKGMADIEGDVVIDFSIEKNNEKITSGSDTIYFGSFEEKTETTKIFLPTSAKSGIYEFVIQVSYGKYIAKSHRTVEIEVNGNIAEINSPKEKFNYKYLVGSIFILIALIVIILYNILYEKKSQQRRAIEIQEIIKRSNSYPQRPIHAITKEESQIKQESASELINDITKEEMERKGPQY
jgi:hypothetical protein